MALVTRNEDNAMTHRAVSSCMAAAMLACSVAGTVKLHAQDAGHDSVAARSRTGRRLFGSSDALRVARVFSPRLSPDGSRVAYLVANVEMKKGEQGKSLTKLWIVPAGGPDSAARQFTRGDRSVSDPEWSPDGKIIAFIRSTGDEKDAKPQVWFMYADGGEPWQVTRHKAGVRGFEFSPDGKTLLLIATSQPDSGDEARQKVKDDAVVVDHDFRMAALWTWTIATGSEKRITNDTVSVTEARWSPDGSRIAFTAAPTPRLDDTDLRSAYVLDVATAHVRKLVETTDATGTARWSPDGAQIAYVTARGAGPYQMNLYVVAANGGAPLKLTANFALDAGEPFWSPDGRTIYFTSDARESIEVFAASVGGGTVRQVTTTPGVIQLAGIDRDGRTAIGTFTDPSHPADVFRWTNGFTSSTAITRQNAWLADYELGATDVTQWKSSKDGLEIDGIVTRPVDYDPSRKYPFLLNPHGGPTGASVLSFNATEQVMAANGYLVLEPNFRGSTGRGEKFESANVNDWGDGDYQDDMSGVDAMIAHGWIDPQRMGAFGWSYGGYMTFWIDTQTDRFKAISPGAGLPDLYSMYAETDIHRYLREFFDLKAPYDNYQEYWNHSPMKYVAKVKTPTMILHGQADTRVPIPQAEEFYRALYDHHVPVEFVTYPRENHGFVEPRHIQDRLQRYLVFFGRYLGNPPVTEPADVVTRMTRDLPGAAGERATGTTRRAHSPGTNGVRVD